MNDKKKGSIAYGSLYMDKGEKIGKAEQQIINVSASKPLVWFFDIVHTRNQTDSAKKMLDDVYLLIYLHNPGLSEDMVIVRLTTNQRVRPAQKIMYKVVTEHNKEISDHTEMRALKQNISIMIKHAKEEDE